MISPNNLANFLDQYLETARFADEPPTVYHPFSRNVSRLGLALEPWPGLADWVRKERLDALFLHRPFKLQECELPDEIGILASHRPFEERLALGYNPRLADALGMSCLKPLGSRKGRPLGMLGDVPPQTVGAFYKSVSETFGGREDARTCERNEVTRVAVVGAMTAELMHEASERGAEVYITGQMRQPAREAILDTGLGVVIVGHRRSEEWALRVLAHVLRERFFGLCVCLPKEPTPAQAPTLPKRVGEEKNKAKAPTAFVRSGGGLCERFLPPESNCGGAGETPPLPEAGSGGRDQALHGLNPPFGRRLIFCERLRFFYRLSGGGC